MNLNMKRLPYGINDFEAVIEQNQYYVDKTMYLPLLENQPSNIFFIRPRRIGKSIFLSMLHAYYDCSKKEKFQTLFGDLWVVNHPTYPTVEVSSSCCSQSLCLGLSSALELPPYLYNFGDNR